MTDTQPDATPDSLSDAITVGVAQMSQMGQMGQMGDPPCGSGHGLEASWSRMEGWAQRARARGVDLLVFPELILSGYHLPPETLAALAQTPQAVAQRLGGIARDSGVSLVLGYPERVAQAKEAVPGGVANSALWVDEAGRLLMNYRKTHLFGAAEAATFARGDLAQHGRVALWRGWRMGLLICYDIEFAGNVLALARAGADAVLVPTANMVGYPAVPRWLVPARAYESQVCVAYANACGSEVWPQARADGAGGAAAVLEYGGLSTLVGPVGPVGPDASGDPQGGCGMGGWHSRWASGTGEELLCATWRLSDLLASRARHPFLRDGRC